VNYVRVIIIVVRQHTLLVGRSFVE
jgi:hypothetical protein